MKIHEAVKELKRHRGRTDIRLAELVDIANNLIRLVVPEQPSDRVAETLNERTLRYYITEGLIDRPLGKEGTAALYGYRHLLQALIVKALQGAYLPIKRIREILRGKSERELEAILSCQSLEKAPGEPEVKSPLDTMLEEVKAMPFLSARQRAYNYLEYLQRSLAPSPPERPREKQLFRLREEQAPGPGDLGPSSTMDVSSQPLRIPEKWERFPLADGIELHLRADRVKDLRPSEIGRLVERLLRSLKGK